MSDKLEKLETFQALAGQLNLDFGRIPTVAERKIRLKLALEELSELAEAFGLKASFIQLLLQNVTNFSGSLDTEEYNELEALDALLDVEYINQGTVVTCGFQKIFDREFDKVHENNMTKFPTDFDIALHSSEMYNIKDQVEVHLDKREIDGTIHYRIIRYPDGKVMKPLNYQKVKLSLDE